MKIRQNNRVGEFNIKLIFIEIILVTLGILIKLAIDNWNTKRLD